MSAIVCRIQKGYLSCLPSSKPMIVSIETSKYDVYRGAFQKINGITIYDSSDLCNLVKIFESDDDLWELIPNRDLIFDNEMNNIIEKILKLQIFS